MNRCYRAAFIIAACSYLCIPVFAMPEFLETFRKDPFRRPGIDGCNTCHMSPEGGDERNAFGQAFEKSAYDRSAPAESISSSATDLPSQFFRSSQTRRDAAQLAISLASTVRPS